MIGVLALQGGFLEHELVLSKLGLPFKRVVEPEPGLTGLIIPGGESTVMDQFMQQYCWVEWLHKVASDFPIYGTCAGLILLARYGLLDVKVDRNAYGRQLASFVETVDVKGLGQLKGAFIRAPKIIQVGEGVEVLAEHDGVPVLVRQGQIWASSFHPELVGETALHERIFSRIDH
jgi:5'-phosphate synthase pdxT subunit